MEFLVTEFFTTSGIHVGVAETTETNSSYNPTTQTLIHAGDRAVFPGDTGFWNGLEHIVDT